MNDPRKKEALRATTTGSSIPDHIPPELVRDWDYWQGPEFLIDPFRALDASRHDRVFWSPHHLGHWVLTRGEDIRASYQNPQLFSSTPASIPPLVGYLRKLLPIELDPPEHGPYRRALNPPFAPNVLRERKGARVTEVARELIGSFSERRACEFMREFALPLPSRVFTEMLGVAGDRLTDFNHWVKDMLHNLDPELRNEAGAKITEYLYEMIDRRTAEPRDDLISSFIASEVNERPMTRDEVLDTSITMFNAGVDTVMTALGWIWKHLAENPEQQRWLAEDPSRIPHAIEELLRLYSFISAARFLSRDAVVCGVQMRKGDAVLLATSLVDRDPAEFEDPLKADLTRKPNRHVAFGLGVHRCIGIHLARLELTTALEQWLARVPTFSIAPDAEMAIHAGPVTGLDQLPLVW